MPACPDPDQGQLEPGETKSSGLPWLSHDPEASFRLHLAALPPHVNMSLKDSRNFQREKCVSKKGTRFAHSAPEHGWVVLGG